MSDEVKTKVWETKATVRTFEEAKVVKDKLLAENPTMLVKIRRSARGAEEARGESFRVRAWQPTEPKKSKSKKTKRKRNKQFA